MPTTDEVNPLDEVSGEFLQFLTHESHDIHSEGLVVIYRSATGARWGSGFGHGTHGVWRELHSSLDDAMDYIEGQRTRGVNWKIVPWPAFKLRVGGRNQRLLLVATCENAITDLSSTARVQLQRRESFPGWTLGILLDSVETLHLFHAPSKFQRFKHGVFRTLYESFSRPSGGNWSFREPLDWQSVKGSSAEDFYKAWMQPSEIQATEDLIYESIRGSVGNKLDFSILTSDGGRVVVPAGKKLTQKDLHLLSAQKKSLVSFPLNPNHDIMKTLRRFRDWD